MVTTEDSVMTVHFFLNSSQYTFVIYRSYPNPSCGAFALWSISRLSRFIMRNAFSVRPIEGSPARWHARQANVTWGAAASGHVRLIPALTLNLKSKQPGSGPRPCPSLNHINPNYSHCPLKPNCCNQARPPGSSAGWCLCVSAPALVVKVPDVPGR